MCLRKVTSICAGLLCATMLTLATCRRPLVDSLRIQSAWAADGVQFEEGDNAACLCCHVDFDGETLTDKHLAQKITCRSCHGPSEAHRQDERLMTKPDLLWGRAEVVAFCKPCHPEHTNADKVAAFRATWQGKIRPDNGRFIGDEPVCTDCHGEHTIRKPR
ncbi:MAG: cytochrome c3 family protein [Candidatus Zipacnadales bacterium]